MPVPGFGKFERFFRAAGGLDVDKNDVRRCEDFVNGKVYDLLLMAQGTARSNGRDIIQPRDLPITKGLQRLSMASSSWTRKPGPCASSTL